MKGVDLTSTGEILATLYPLELVDLFNRSPKVGLNFSKIFDFKEDASGEESEERHEDGTASPPPSPSSRKVREKVDDKDKDDTSSENSTPSSGTSAANTRKQQAAAPLSTRILRPSIPSSHRASRGQPATLPRVLLGST